MRIIFNFSSIRIGGALQVAHSVITELPTYTHNEYLLIITKEVRQYITNLPQAPNITIQQYNASLSKKLLKTNSPLAQWEKEFQPDVVFTLFGPAYWRPKAPHIVGFARPDYVYKESPFFQVISFKEKIKNFIYDKVHIALFKTESDAIVSETEDVRDRIGNRLGLPSYYVSNTYNTVFDKPIEKSLEKKADTFKLLLVAAPYRHKNHIIIPKVIDELLKIDPNFKFKFTLTIQPQDLPKLQPKHKPYVDFIGSVKIEQVPALFKQADAMFLPTLLECFSASYVEAMKMEVPILTSDLSFATTICSDAAAYFDPTDAQDIAKTIYTLYKDKNYQNQLIENGKQRLSHFLNAQQRVEKYHDIMVEVVGNYSENKK